jgi:hypothetical protein
VLRPPKERTWAPRGTRPVVKVRGARGRPSIAGMACYQPCDRPHLYDQLPVHCRRKGEPNFTAADQGGLVRIIKRKLKKIQYWTYLIDGCLAATGLKSSLGDHMAHSSSWLRRY